MSKIQDKEYIEDNINQNAKIQLNIAKNVGVEILNLDLISDFNEFDCLVLVTCRPCDFRQLGSAYR